MAKPVLNFDVLPTYDSRVLAIADLSIWAHLVDEASYIDITLPGRKTPVTYGFGKNKVNKFNSSSLGYGCADCEDDLIPLPDGIYKIKIYSCEGNKFYLEKHYLRSVQLELDIQSLIVSINIECNPDSSCLTQIQKAELYLKGAKADLVFGNINAANRKFNAAVELVEDLENCECESNCSEENGYSTTSF